MSSPKAWMPVFIGDYLGDTAHLTTVQHGAYLLLLFFAWRCGGSLPDNDAQLAAIARLPLDVWREEVSPVVRPFFYAQGGTLRQRRLEKELAEATVRTEKSAAKASTAGRTRWERHRAAKADAPSIAPSSASSTPQAVLMQCPSPSPSPPPSEDGTSLPSEAQSQQHASTRTKADKEPRGTQLPEDWQPSEDDVAFARDEGVDLEREAAKFRDHWLGKTGKDSRKRNWSRCWRNWCRESADRKQRRGGPQLAVTNERPQPTLPALFDPPEAWLHLAPESETDSRGVTHPVVGGHYLDVAVKTACEAAGIHDPAYRPDVETVARWLQDGIDVPRIRAAITRVAGRDRYVPPSRLRFFDGAVRDPPQRMRA